jgi:hypothetical protein
MERDLASVNAASSLQQKRRFWEEKVTKCMQDVRASVAKLHGELHTSAFCERGGDFHGSPFYVQQALRLLEGFLVNWPDDAYCGPWPRMTLEEPGYGRRRLQRLVSRRLLQLWRRFPGLTATVSK